MTSSNRDSRSLFNRSLDRRTALKYGAASAGALGASRFLLAGAQDASPAAVEGPQDFGTADLEISGDVEIQYWQYELAAKTALVEELIPEFEEANPGITIRHEVYPYDDFRQQVAAAVQAGEGPDVLNVFFGWVPAYVQQQFLVPFPQDIFPHDQIEEHFFPMVQSSKIQGEYYALPIAVRTLALFCNNDLMEEAGIEPPTTWDELIEAAKATTKKDGDNFETVGFTWDIGGQGHNWWREGLIRQNGGAPSSDDNRTLQWTSPEAVEAFNYHCSFLLEHGVTQSGFQTDGATAFASGSAGFHVDGSYRVGSYLNDAPDLNYSIVPLPEKEQKSSFASYWANTITRNAAEGDKLIAAAKWIDFLSSAGVQQRWTPATGELPARTALAADPALVEDEKLAPFIESLEFSYASFIVNEADLRQAVMDAYDQVTLNGLDPEMALQEAQDKVQVQLDEYWAQVDG
jgi:multiple sugar transport system substrate-binding protein